MTDAYTFVTVDFASAGGAPAYHASGMIYGMTPDGSLPQDHFFKDIKWHYMRAGGAQLNSGGYATSLADHRTRWNSTLAQYKRTVALGGTFVLLPHDLWGADGTTGQGRPGGNGDRTQFDASEHGDPIRLACGAIVSLHGVIGFPLRGQSAR
ncbi:hypothetical protein OG747_01710 [Streptomyces sp. NBC_01384]|uniref:hypothetical protein n=1 Tax=Streptomyces sp. NBC_01384 TaxID=2903847 RepID=UPI00324B77CD